MSNVAYLSGFIPNSHKKILLKYLIKLQFQVQITRGHTQGDKETYVLILLQRIPTWEDQGQDHNPPDFPHQSVAMSSHYYLIWIKSFTIRPVLKHIQVNFKKGCLFVNPYMGGSGGGSQSPGFSTQIGSDIKPLLLDLDKVLHHQACFETHTGKFLKMYVCLWED